MFFENYYLIENQTFSTYKIYTNFKFFNEIIIFVKYILQNNTFRNILFAKHMWSLQSQVKLRSPYHFLSQLFRFGSQNFTYNSEY
jgi:hypothetical protein